MKNLNDARVAKALGWKYGWDKDSRNMEWKLNGEFKWLEEQPPPFTTSLDAIVAEIDSRQVRPFCLEWLEKKNLNPWLAENVCLALLACLKRK